MMVSALALIACVASQANAEGTKVTMQQLFATLSSGSQMRALTTTASDPKPFQEAVREALNTHPCDSFQASLGKALPNCKKDHSR
jgi:hypothetical protein